MSKHGRIEAGIYFSTQQEIEFDDGASSPETVTFPAGTWYWTDVAGGGNSLLDRIATNLTGGGNWSVTLSKGEGGTGRVTITTTDTPFSVTFGSTLIREVFGFAADLSSVSAAQTGTYHAKGLWLPDCPIWTPHGADLALATTANVRAAATVSDIRQTVGPRGQVHTLASNAFREYRNVRWEGITRRRAKLIGEVIAGESFESFWRSTQLAESGIRSEWTTTPFRVGSPLQMFWSADATYASKVKLVGLTEFDPSTVIPNYVGRYVITLPRLVIVP